MKAKNEKTTDLAARILDQLGAGPASTSELRAVLRPNDKNTSAIVKAARRLRRAGKVAIGPLRRGGSVISLIDARRPVDVAAQTTPPAAIDRYLAQYAVGANPDRSGGRGTEHVIGLLVDLLPREKMIEVVAAMINGRRIR